MSQNKTATKPFFLVGCTNVFSALAWVMLFSAVSNSAEARCNSYEEQRSMPAVVFEYVRVTSAIENRSMSNFQSAARGLVKQTEQMVPALHKEIRSPQSTGGECQSMGYVLSQGARRLANAKNLQEAQFEIIEFKKLIALWTFLTRAD